MSFNILRKIFLGSIFLIVIIFILVRIDKYYRQSFSQPVIIHSSIFTPPAEQVSETAPEEMAIQKPVSGKAIVVSTPSQKNFESEDLTPIQLGEVMLLASVANTSYSRELGLSGTVTLPVGTVKLFIFDTTERWGFWMRDMNYPIDVIWLDEQKKVVHIEHSINPNTYPNSFTPSAPAKYVIETNAGFSIENQIEVGTVAIFQ